MRFRVRHLTRYRYAAPIELGPHLLRLTPRSGTDMVHELDVTPRPDFRDDETDVHGNRATRLGFRGRTRELVIESRFTVETRGAPAAGGAPELCLAPGPADPVLDAFAARTRDEIGGDPQLFATVLSKTLHRIIDHDIRDTGGARSPAETLATRAGACRDIAVLYVDVCRRAGIAARYVSGYQAESSRPTARRYLHAWPEVWLPERGWRGYDPTRGIAVGETHVALAAAPDQAGTMPVEGSYFGVPVASTLDFELEIDATA